MSQLHKRLNNGLTHHSALKKANANHAFLSDLAEKSELFDKAAAKYKPKVAG